MLTVEQIAYIILGLVIILIYFYAKDVEERIGSLRYTFREWKKDYWKEKAEAEQDIYLLGELVIDYEEKSYWLQKRVDWLDDQLGIAEDEYSALEFENIGLQNEITQLENENAELNDELLSEEE